jgi:polysaccharide export outer membrane protein
MQALGRYRLLWLFLGTCLTSAGCHHLESQTVLPDAPRENRKVTIGDYVINPPDELIIELLRAVPLPPYKIKPLDQLFVYAPGAPPEDPIKGVYQVEPEGFIRFGVVYGPVQIADFTIDEAIKAIEGQLKKAGLINPKVSISLEQTRGVQLIRGPHLVRPDGTVNLGIYGRVAVAGLTQEAAREAIEEHLSQYFLKPSISLDVAGFNSSVYYIIFDGGGNGEQVNRFPFTGSETVLDAIGGVAGLPAVASKSRIWLARPYEGQAESELLPVDWRAITQLGRPETNYQIFPGDRIYVAAQPIIRADTLLARYLAPVERILGILLLGNSAVHGFVPIGFAGSAIGR